MSIPLNQTDGNALDQISKIGSPNQDGSFMQTLSQENFAGVGNLGKTDLAKSEALVSSLGFPGGNFLDMGADSFPRMSRAGSGPDSPAEPLQAKGEVETATQNPESAPSKAPDSAVNGAQFHKQADADQTQIGKDVKALKEEKDPSKEAVSEVRTAKSELNQAQANRSIGDLQQAQTDLSRVKLAGEGGGNGGNGGAGNGGGGDGGNGGGGDGGNGGAGNGGGGDGGNGGGGNGGGGNGGGGNGGDGGGGSGSTNSGLGADATTFGPGAMGKVDTTQAGYYVSADATGKGNGSENNPYTLQQAQQAMETGDIKTAYLEGGTYDMSSALSLGSKDSGETWESIGGASNPVIFNGEGKANSLVNLDSADNVNIKGVEFENTSSTPIWGSKWNSSAENSGAIFAQNTTGDNFSDNSFTNVNAAINEQNVSSSTMDGNLIDNAQTGIYMGANSSGQYGSDNTIGSNDFENITSGGPKLFDNYGAVTMDGVSNTTIDNNIFQHTFGVAIQGTYSQTGSGFTIANNTINDTDYDATAGKPDTSSNPEGDNGAIHIIESPTRNVSLNGTIEYNDINDFGINRADEGVYLDNNVRGINVTGNAISGTNGDDIKLHGASDIQVADNYLQVSSDVGGVDSQSYDNGTMSGNSFDNNWFSGTSGNAYSLVDMQGQPQSQYSDNQYADGVDHSQDSKGTTNSDLTLAQWEKLVLDIIL